jgi:hypothetical protein
MILYPGTTLSSGGFSPNSGTVTVDPDLIEPPGDAIADQGFDEAGSASICAW